ncbi:trimeric intracellular cation channel family protein [Microbacterium resistens]
MAAAGETHIAFPRRVRDVPGLPPRVFDAIDVAATGLFGLEGALAAAHAGLDVLGVVVVGFLVALGGGILRDVLLGDLPPAAFRSPVRIVVALAAAVLAFVAFATIDTVPTALLAVLDAVGMALFAVTGAQKAVEHGMSLWVVGVLGTLTATGGGILRDVLLRRTALVLSESVYGTAALLGAVLTGVLLRTMPLPRLALLLGFVSAAALRIAAYFGDWQLPRIDG